MNRWQQVVRRGVVTAAFGASILLGCGGSQVDSGGSGRSEARATAGLATDVRQYEIEGVPILHKRTPSNRIVAMQLVVPRGSAQVRAADAGALRLALAVMQSGGPQGLDRATWTSTLANAGISVGGVVGYDTTAISVSCVVPVFSEAVSLLGRALTEPAMREADIERERTQALAALRSENDDPDASVGIVARETIFADHPYAVRPEGTQQTVAGFTEADLRDAMQSVQSRDGMVVVVVGDVDEASVRAALAPLLSGLSHVAPTPLPVPELTPRPTNVSAIAREGVPTTYVLGYFPAPAPGHRDYPVLRLALDVLSDRLFEEVRTRRNLTYAVSAGLGGRHANTGYLYVTATDPTTTMDVIFDTIQSLEVQPPTDQALADQLAAWTTGFYMGLSSNEAIASQLAAWFLRTGNPADADASVAAMADVTPLDVARVLGQYVRDIQFGVVTDDVDALNRTPFLRR